MVKKYAKLFDKALTVLSIINYVLWVVVGFFSGMTFLPFLFAPLFAIIGAGIAFLLNVIVIGFFCQITEIRRLLAKIADESDNPLLEGKESSEY